MRLNGRRERDRVFTKHQRVAAVHAADQMREQVFVELHHLVNRPIRRIQFEHRKLGIVRGVDAFVAEDAADLVDPLEAADDQAFEIEFGRDAQREPIYRARCSG